MEIRFVDAKMPKELGDVVRCMVQYNIKGIEEGGKYVVVARPEHRMRMQGALRYTGLYWLVAESQMGGVEGRENHILNAVGVAAENVENPDIFAWVDRKSLAHFPNGIFVYESDD